MFESLVNSSSGKTSKQTLYLYSRLRALLIQVVVKLLAVDVMATYSLRALLIQVVVKHRRLDLLSPLRLRALLIQVVVKQCVLLCYG